MKYRDRIQAKRSFKKALLVTAATMTLGLGTVGGTTSAFADVAVSETATGTSTAITFGQFKFSPEVGKLNEYTDHIYTAGVGEFIDVLQLAPSHSTAKTSVNLTGLQKNTKYTMRVSMRVMDVGNKGQKVQLDFANKEKKEFTVKGSGPNELYQDIELPFTTGDNPVGADGTASITVDGDKEVFIKEVKVDKSETAPETTPETKTVISLDSFTTKGSGTSYGSFGDEKALGTTEENFKSGITTVLPNLKKNTEYKLVVTARKQNPNVSQGVQIEFANKKLKEFGLSGGDVKKLEASFTTDNNPTGDNARINILLNHTDTQLIISSAELFEIKSSSTNQPEGSSTNQPEGSSTSQPEGSSTNQPGGFTGWVDLPSIDKNHDKLGYKENGEFVTGLKQIDGYVYYLDDNHYVLYGWKVIDGKSYYFDPAYQGTMTQGETITIKGKSYTFDSKGVCTNPPS